MHAASLSALSALRPPTKNPAGRGSTESEMTFPTSCNSVWQVASSDGRGKKINVRTEQLEITAIS